MENSLKKNKLGYIYLITVFILWGSLYVVSKYVLGKMPAFTISFIRFTLAFFSLTIIQKIQKTKQNQYKANTKIQYQGKKEIDPKAKPYILLIGIAGYFIAVGAQLLGTKYAKASIASLINSLNPITIMIFAAIILHEKLSVRKVLGIVIAVCGVYIILGSGSKNTSVFGIILSLFAVILWSLVSVYTKEAAKKYNSLQITRYSIGIAAICYFPVSVYEIIKIGTIKVDLTCILSLMYMGIICTGVAYLLWNKSLSILEAGTCSAFYPIQPLVSTILGIIFLDEKISLNFWLGAVLIAIGVITSLTFEHSPKL